MSAPDATPPASALDGLDKVHVVGVGGSGMSGIATMLARLGHTVSGSDVRESEIIRRLAAAGVVASVGHDARNLPEGLDAVVVSTAIPPDNPEVVAARERGIPVLRRSEMLAMLVGLRRTIAVAGTHGKTTTSSMLSLILRGAGWKPSFLIGGDVTEVGGNAVVDEGEWLVVEADESDGTFLELDPEAVIVTSVEADHLDHFGTFDALVESFSTFLARPAGPKVVCADDPVASALAGAAGAITYGVADDADYRIEGYVGGRSGSRFLLRARGALLGELRVAGPGLHNARNAAGAAACAFELGVELEPVVAALGRFAGVARRFQFHGVIDGITLVDDYAHLPGEIRAALAAAQEGGWARVVAVFQPHRYSRTELLWRDFGPVFEDADLLVLTDVYGAGEVPRPGVSGHLVLDAVHESCPGLPVVYVPHRVDVLDEVRRLASDGDLVLTLGAGDLPSLAAEWREVASAPAVEPSAPGSGDR